MLNQVLPEIDEANLEALLEQFRQAVRRDMDRGLADEIQTQVLGLKHSWLTVSTTQKLARWCKTNGFPYQEGMPVAQRISQVLFGNILDRNLLNT